MKLRLSEILCSSLVLCALFQPAVAADKAQETKQWTDPIIATQEDADFLIQGEYGSENSGAELGIQVVALGDGKFDAYVLEDGLPGLGWTREKTKTKLQGQRSEGAIAFQNTEQGIVGEIKEGKFELIQKDGEKHSFPRIERQSPSLGAPAPDGAVVLFDGRSTEAWENGKMENGLLLATGCTSKQEFGSYTLHVEFRTPYMPSARGQGRGNSGIYHSGRWETQILDSFGLEGEENQAGGIYSVSKPRLNMCFPPLTWQTYDVDFTAAEFDAAGKIKAHPRITVRLNGVLVHEDLELNKDFTASAPISSPLSSPTGPVFLQNHKNPVVYRNIWIVPKD